MKKTIVSGFKFLMALKDLNILYPFSWNARGEESPILFFGGNQFSIK
jgi:hypothetical protein